MLVKAQYCLQKNLPREGNHKQSSSKYIRITWNIFFHLYSIRSTIKHIFVVYVFTDFLKAVWRLLKNKILIFRTASSVLHILPIAGLYTFLPKYLESQFRLPVHSAALVSGQFLLSILPFFIQSKLFEHLSFTICAHIGKHMLIIHSNLVCIFMYAGSGCRCLGFHMFITHQYYCFCHYSVLFFLF